MSKKAPSKPLRLSKAARILGIPLHTARRQQIPRLFDELQCLLAAPPEWLGPAQVERRAIAAANLQEEQARVAAKQAAVASAKKALVAELQSAPAYDTRSEEFAFLALDGAMLSLMGRYPESVLDAAARDLYPEAAEHLLEGEIDA